MDMSTFIVFVDSCQDIHVFGYDRYEYTVGWGAELKDLSAIMSKA